MSKQCEFCHLVWEEDDDWSVICNSAGAAARCHNMKPLRFKPRAVGTDFVPVVDDPAQIADWQAMIDDGSAWSPTIDTDGFCGRTANSLIERKICKPPRAVAARLNRLTFGSR
jgi:hypothetical protein